MKKEKKKNKIEKGFEETYYWTVKPRRCGRITTKKMRDNH